MKLREGNVFSHVCLSVHRGWGEWDIYGHYSWYIGPHCTGTPYWRPPLETCWNLFNWGPPHLYWHLVVMKARRVDKWVVRILLECLLVCRNESTCNGFEERQKNLQTLYFLKPFEIPQFPLLILSLLCFCVEFSDARYTYWWPLMQFLKSKKVLIPFPWSDFEWFYRCDVLSRESAFSYGFEMFTQEVGIF